MFTKPEGNPWAFYLLNARTGAYEMTIDEFNNSHCVYLLGNKWILNDTYPLGDIGGSHLYLYHVPTGKRVVLGAFPALAGWGEGRCAVQSRRYEDCF